MKKQKFGIIAVLVVLYAIGWLAFFSGRTQAGVDYAQLIKNAEESAGKRLYVQAAEFYKAAWESVPDVDIYKKITNLYDQYYEEEHTPEVLGEYMDVVGDVIDKYPEVSEFWDKGIALNIEAGDERNAYKLAKSAIMSGISSELVQGEYKKLKYTISDGYKRFEKYHTADNGYISVYNGEVWRVADNRCNEMSAGYSYIGPLSDDGYGLYRNDIDLRLMDAVNVIRARYAIEIDEAGVYSTESGMAPVRIGSTWQYLKSDGTSAEGRYEMAGSYVDGKAAVCSEGKWYLINEAGETVSEVFEEILLDSHGRYLNDGIILAKEEGKFHIYNEKWEQQGDFSADDADRSPAEGLIAFASGEKWGFADSDGNIVFAPVFAGARGFSNGLAAVKDESGRWGFVDEEFETVIDCRYLETGYFNNDGACIVSTDEGSYHTISLKYE